MHARATISPLDAFRSLWRCVGRERELVALEQLQITALADGRGRIAYVSGPAGIGKTRLAEELKRRLAGRGTIVIDGHCGDGARAWQPALDVVTQSVRALLDAGAVPLAVRGAELADALRGRLGDRPDAPTQDVRTPAGAQARFALFERVAAFLTETARVMPLAIVLHDLHLADGATRALLHHLAHTRFPTPELDAPVPVPLDDRLRGLLVVTSREADAGWLAGSNVTSFALGALDESGVRDFLQSPEVIRLVASATGGRPSALEALLEASLPDAEQQLLGRLEELSPPARRLIEALAVLGRPGSADALWRICGQPTGAPQAAAVAELVASHLAKRRVVAGEPRLALLHPGSEDTIRRTLDEARRDELHIAVGRELLAHGDDGDRAAAAENLVAGGGGEEAVDVALAAGAQLEAACGHERAIALYRSAWSLTARDSVRADLEGRLVELQRLTGDYAAALTDAQRLLARRPDDTATMRSIGQLYLLRDEYGAARATLARARELALLADDRLELARVIAASAEVCLLEGRHQDATAECAVGLDATEGDYAGAPEAVWLRLEIRNTLGKVHLAESRFGEADALFTRNLAEASEHGVAFEEARAHINLGIARLRLGDHEAAAGCYQSALKVATAAGDHRHRAFCLQNLGVLAHWKAEYTTALRYFHEALSAFKRIGQRGRLAWIALDLASLYLELGALDRADAMARLAERLGDQQAGATVRHKRAIIAARIARSEGSLGRARGLLTAACDAVAKSAPDLYCEAATLLGWVELDAGDAAAATRVLNQSARHAGDHPPSMAARGRLALLTGEVRLSRAEPAPARQALLEAADIFHRVGDADGEWRAHCALGRVATVEADHAEAERRYRRAGQIDARLRDSVPEELRTHLDGDPVRRALARALADIDPRAVSAPPSASADRGRVATIDAPPRAALAAASDRFERLIGRHPRMRQVYSLVEKVARHQSVILIRGESGTGKELIAEAIHARSARAGEALIKVNCGALVETLLLSELFGHERGAFTGAVQRKKGRFESADRGTIFLDEIGDISPRTQSALLRVIQEREFERVGSTTPIKVDVRIICATNRDLEAMVAQGEFREDLYYRLNGIQIDLPPLRDRPEDIPLLAADLMARVDEERGGGPRSLSPAAMERLCGYRWPGNVRELENVIRSVTLFAEGDVISLDDLRDHPEILAPPRDGVQPRIDQRGELATTAVVRDAEATAWGRLGAEGIGLRELQERIEIECITRALAQSRGNITRAADILKMKRPRLSQLIKEHGIALPRDEGSSCGQS